MDFSYKKFYQNDLFVLKLAGVFANENNNYLNVFKYYHYFVNIFFLCIINAVMTMNWIIRTDGLRSFAALGYIILVLVMGQVKSIFLYLNRNEFGVIITDLNIKLFQPRGEAEMVFIRSAYNHYEKFRKLLLWSCWVSISSAISTPLISGIEGALPVPSWYPINIYYSPAFEIAYVHQAVCILFISFLNVYTDLIIGGFLTFIGLQCDLLSYRISELGYQGPISENVWIECIQHHKQILGYLHTTEKVFGKIYFFQIFATTSAMCMNLFLLSLIEPSFEFFYLIAYFFAVCNLLFVPCWFATQMTRKSENLPTAAYSCNWADATTSFKKGLLIFMTRSQRPLQLFAANYFVISVDIFAMIVRSALSYFAVLQNLNTAERGQHAVE